MFLTNFKFATMRPSRIYDSGTFGYFICKLTVNRKSLHQEVGYLRD